MDFKCEILGHYNHPIRFIGLNPQIQEASNRTWCNNCLTGQSNMVNLEIFYSIVDKISEQNKFSELLNGIQVQLDQNYELFEKIMSPLVNVFKEFQNKLKETNNKFHYMKNLFNYRDENFNLQKLQQLAHIVSGKEVEKLQEHLISLQREKLQFYNQLCETLDLIKNKINSRESNKFVQNTPINVNWKQIISHPFRQELNCLSSNYDGSLIFSGGKQWNDDEESCGMIHEKIANNIINSKVYGAHSRPIQGVVMTNDSIITFSDDQTVREGRLDKGKQLLLEVYVCTNLKPSVISISDNQEQLLVGGVDGSIEIWKRRDSHNKLSRWEIKNDIQKLIHDESPLTLLQIDKAENQIFSGSSNNQLVIWNRAITRWKINQILHNEQNFMFISLQDDVNFVTGMQNGEVNCYRRDKNKVYEKIHQFKASSIIRQMLFYDKTLLILGQDGIFVYVKMDSQSYQQTFYQKNNYQEVTLSKDGKIIVAQGLDQIVYFQQSDSV